MRQGQVAALLTRLPANPQQERLLSSLAAAAGPLSAAVGCTGAASSRAGRLQQLSTLTTGTLLAQPPHTAAMPSGTVLRPAGRLEPSLPHLGWSVSGRPLSEHSRCMSPRSLCAQRARRAGSWVVP